jgi:hypothetical protein
VKTIEVILKGTTPPEKDTIQWASFDSRRHQLVETADPPTNTIDIAWSAVVEGLTEEQEHALLDAGYHSKESILEAGEDKIRADVLGVGRSTATKLVEWCLHE